MPEQFSCPTLFKSLERKLKQANREVMEMEEGEVRDEMVQAIIGITNAMGRIRDNVAVINNLLVVLG